MQKYHFIIVGTGPAGLGAAFAIKKEKPNSSVLMLDSNSLCTGGLRNDCKMNFTYPIGFPEENWTEAQANYYLEKVADKLKPNIMERVNLGVYKRRAEKLGVRLLEVDQTHLGTDGGLLLIKQLNSELEGMGVEQSLGETMLSVDPLERKLKTSKRELAYDSLLVAPGRKGFQFLQDMLDSINVPFVDHTVDIGVRVETKLSSFPIVKDYYDPKFLFPEKVRTFCTNSGNAYVVQEKYQSRTGKTFFSVNGHAFSQKGKNTGLVNFAMLRTIRFTEPLASGQEFAENLGLQAMLMGGNKPIMQRVGDFRLGKRSKESTFNNDLYDFKATLQTCTPGDISLAMPAKILRSIWKAMKNLDTIVPGILHPSTIMYYPEIKLYANKPQFLDDKFKVAEGVYLAGDGAGTSRGITAAWASGIRAAEGMLLSSS